MAFSAKSMIEQMQARYKELAVKLEGYQAIQEEMATLSKAIKVMKGEKLGPGGPKGPRKSKQEWAGRIIDAAEQEEKPAKLRLPTTVNGNSGTVKQLLKDHPKGMTVGEIGEELRKNGLVVTDHTVHNAIRPFRSQVVVSGTRKSPTGQQQNVYSLKKGD